MVEHAGDSKVILITGTSSGIGLYTAVELARRGHRVFASMRHLGRSGDLQAAATDAGVAIDLVELDVRSQESAQQAVAHVVSVAGRLDVVVNNAAVATYAPIEFTSIDAATTMFDTNVLGPVRVVQAALPVMRRQGTGRIVNVGSVASEPRLGFRLLGLYGATKAALHSLSLELNKELAPLGIEVVLCEGDIGGRTAMFDGLDEGIARFGQGEGAYSRVETTARVFADVLNAQATAPVAAANVIADASTLPTPGLRHPRSAQAPIDAVRLMRDDDFLRLCAYDPDAIAITQQYDPVPSLWTVG